VGRQHRDPKSHDAISEHDAVHKAACLPKASEEWRECAAVRLRVVGGARSTLAGFSAGGAALGFGDAALQGWLVVVQAVGVVQPKKVCPCLTASGVHHGRRSEVDRCRSARCTVGLLVVRLRRPPTDTIKRDNASLLRTQACKSARDSASDRASYLPKHTTPVVITPHSPACARPVRSQV
jgi:hypothetical protein